MTEIGRASEVAAGARPANAPAASGAPPTRFHPRRLPLLLGPVVVVALVWWLVSALTSRTVADEALAAGGVFLTFVGPAVIFGPAVVGANVFEHLTTWGLVAITAFFTCASAFFYAFNLDLLERVPRLGPWLRGVHGSMEATLEAKPWIRRFAVLGVGLFVLLPLPGSGSLGGAILGRLVGLSRIRTFLAVTAGGVVVCFAYGQFGEELRRFGASHQLGLPAKIAGALGFLVLLAVIGRLLGRRARATTAPRTDVEGR